MKIRSCRIVLVFWICFWVIPAGGVGAAGAADQAGIVTERNIRDAILERRTFTAEELAQLDLNGDGKVDAADLVIQQDQEISEMMMSRRFVGSMVFDVDFILSAQKIEMVLPDVQSAFQAEFTPEDSLLFSAPFTMSGSLSSGTPVFSSTAHGVMGADDLKNPLGRDLSWELAITETRLEKGFLKGLFVLTYTGLKLTSEPFETTGVLYMAEQFTDDDKFIFEDADDMARLIELYGL